MRKLISTTIILLSVWGFNVFAQTQEQMQQSLQRIEKLTEVIEKAPKPCGIEAIDSYTTATIAACKHAIQNSESLNQIYNAKNNGEIIDPTVLITLSTSIKEEGEEVKALAEKMKPAMEAIKKEKNPMKLKKLKSAIDFSDKATSLLTEESVAQAAILAELTK